MTTTFDATLALRAEGLLGTFNRAGILNAADVHVASRLGAMAGETDDAVLLAAALLVRSTRSGSVVLDLDTAEATTTPDLDEEGESCPADIALEWPSNWVSRCAASSLIGGPLRMVGSRLWLARYWDQEEQVANEMLERSSSRPDDLALDILKAGLERLFVSGEDDDQRLAAACCALSRVSVLAGGPGTGKTTTVSRLLALLREQHPQWRIALAAPTGKAAARLEEAVRSSTAALTGEADRERVKELSATTLHRLLGSRPGSRSSFRHDRTNRLPFEVVVVDESSMVSLTMMARLLEALRPTTRLVLVGDPDQLASVEAGAVLGDLVDRDTLDRRTPAFMTALRKAIPAVTLTEQPESPARLVRDGVTALTKNWRFPEDSAMAQLAAAVQRGQAEDALAVLRSGSQGVGFVEVEDGVRLPDQALLDVQSVIQTWGAELLKAAEKGDAGAALQALESHRLLCAHRSGPRGVQHWDGLAARWIALNNPVAPRPDGRYVGEPLLITTNDYDIGLYNGDTGVVIKDGKGGMVAVFGRGGEPIEVPLVRLGAVRSVHAMTVHRSQGSEFDSITVLLPPANSPLGTRETLYTAVTRAKNDVRVIGSAEAFVAAVRRPAARATGLRSRLLPGA